MLQFVIYAVLVLNGCLGYDPTKLLPFKELSDHDISVIGNRFNCSELKSDVKSCAENCLKESLNSGNCAGILTGNSGCYLCKNLNRSEVDSGQYTTFISDQKFYLLNTPRLEPNIYISMEDFDVSTGIITGKGVSGGSVGIEADDLIIGKIGQAIHLEGGDRLYPAVSQPECFCNFYFCQGKMSLTFWMRSYMTQYTKCNVIKTVKPGLSVYYPDTIKGSFVYMDIFYENFLTTSYASAAEWSFITFTIDIEVGFTSYFNSIQEGFESVSLGDVDTSAGDWSCGDMIFGVKNLNGDEPMNGDLDEIKYFYYKALTPTQILAEYLGDEGIDLGVPLIAWNGYGSIGSENVVNSDVTPNVIVDGNVTSCLALDTYSGLGFKLYNMASDKKNFTVTVFTDNLECGSSAIIAYGDQQTTGDIYSTYTGMFTELQMEGGSGGECMFRWNNDEYLPYVFLRVFNHPFVQNVAVCEVEFK